MNSKKRNGDRKEASASINARKRKYKRQFADAPRQKVKNKSSIDGMTKVVITNGILTRNAKMLK